MACYRKLLPFLLVLILALAAGCQSMQQGSGPTSAGLDAQTAATQEPAGRYYEFEDIQVPRDLKLSKEESILFRVDNFKCGLLVFSERLDAESIINYFIESMSKDNWVLKSSFKYPSAALFFAKKGKTCVIRIIESSFSTRVEIWVAPSM